MNIKDILEQKLAEVILNVYQLKDIKLEIQENKTEFEGDFTIVTFPLVKQLKKNPESIGVELGEGLTTQTELLESFNVIKGFLNVKVKNQFFVDQFKTVAEQFSNIEKKNATVMVEYSSPNTNKPLHLGHIRNNLLGFSVAQILKEAGYDVIKSQIINDRGIHICKSMLAWEKFGKGETPETDQVKGDKFVGNYYVKFDQEYKKEIAELVEQGSTEDQAKKEAPLMKEAQKMLLDWESGDEKVRTLWAEMNSWVYNGFNQTYKRLGVDFDQVQYESNTYILGKDLIQEGLDKSVLYQKEDGSVWCDLTDEGLDEKLLLRSDGTSVYMTQDLGTAVERFKENNIQKLIYTVGNEQDYHFHVLFKILKKLGYEWADQLFHLSYGMVELPEGKMKSREGTVVDADDLMQDMFETAKEKTEELGKLEGLADEEKVVSYEIIGQAALKYFMLKVDPKKKMLFNPADSIDFNGNTGPFILYTYARTQSLLAKANYEYKEVSNIEFNQYEKELIMLLSNYKATVEKAAELLSPALVANYLYDLVKTYNSFYQSNPILKSEDEDLKQFRLNVSDLTAKTIQKSLSLLGIRTVNRM
ncbi:arginine--tRNA ligase [Chryseobacterium indoltheticum]|uniref:Arginine--tRNA ligase n=1 Tax=Chryseobacterium indoltheticum TaxID=254 RepID=A0A381F8F8_9FLAO|nr:arginine--tRNA ligase [Chryseobacterium indoltheticum]AZA73176.1 arginine--tRNA ligase [Chryseobacterium indoltheticum]SIP96128.1 arginyl-tRNA synthetase [Chryseobacterium indoltheticum]SUX42866.1 Arginine--tRNA ligase [Chryseobacterium indoltheticum]